MHDMIKQWMTTEDFGVKYCDDYAKKLEVKKIEESLEFKDKRYFANFLWKNNKVINMPESRSMAAKRSRILKKKLSKNPLDKQWLKGHMQSLIDKGYVRKLTSDELKLPENKVWYSPLLIAYNYNKDPPKRRLVWDSAAISRGVSLNSCLSAGVDNLIPLTQGLCRMREYEVAVNSDVKEMFHQVKMRDESLPFNRFLFSLEEDEEDGDYVGLSMLFGPTCSPCIANIVKNFHAKKYAESKPEASDQLINGTYVDDSFNSFKSVNEAIKVTKDAIEICKDMSWDLVGIQSNSQEVLKNLPKMNVKENLIELNNDNNNLLTITKVLGMHWITKKDVFIFKRKQDELLNSMLNGEIIATKREMLKVLLRIFDPLGLIANFLIKGKLILQQIWRLGLDWDEQITEEMNSHWVEFLVSLEKIEDLEFSRKYFHVNPDICEIWMITFGDASGDAFSCNVYFRLEDPENRVEVAFIGSKARVAPVKPLSIPRLELQAALLSARWGSTIKKIHRYNIKKQIFLSDSQCVLSWITDPKFKHDKFVGSRIGEILESTEPCEWFYVPSKHNVADEATKRMKILDENRWIDGPTYLKQPFEEWPIKIAREVYHVTVQPPEVSWFDLYDTVTLYKWSKLVRVTGYVLRAADYMRQRISKFKLKYEGKREPRKFSGPLSEREKEDAKRFIFTKIQEEAFKDDISDLIKDQQTEFGRYDERSHVKTSSSIFKLRPFLNEHGEIRIFTRLPDNEQWDGNQRFPILLPNKHKIVDVYIRYMHMRNYHVGIEKTISDIRESVWIIGIRQALRRVTSKCGVCKILSAQPRLPQMGMLHKSRTDFHSPAFSNVGLDCFGPIKVKQGRTYAKRWVLIVTCLTFRGVRLELLKDMTANSIIGAIRRATGRESYLKTVYSDNGSNFVGAINEQFKNADEAEKALGFEAANKLNVTWHFIARYSPWMGGAWERLIGTIKKVLNQILLNQEPDDWILRDALMEVEIFMNKRPLTHTPINPDDPRPLTPNDGILRGPNQRENINVINESDEFFKLNYKRAQILGNRLIERFSKEYLQTINNLSKKSLLRKNLIIGDVVLVTEPNQPRKEWEMGVITKVYPSKDGVSRTIDVKMKDGSVQVRRSVGRCALVDIRGESSLN
jgi:hypothetical protein